MKTFEQQYTESSSTVPSNTFGASSSGYQGQSSSSPDLGGDVDSGSSNNISYATNGGNGGNGTGASGLSSDTTDINEIDVNSEGGAGEINAAITREQWEDYKARFQPYEDRLAAIFKNGGLMEGEAERIPEAVNQSFDTMRGIADRRLSRYGIAPNKDQTTSRDRMASLDKAIASVDAKNNLWATADERQDKIMTGGIDTMRKGS
jgi:hypothetical protein